MSMFNKIKNKAVKDEKERVYRINEAAADYFHDQLLQSPAGGVVGAFG